MSYWQFVPLDILTSLLPYFEFETLEEIEAFTADPYIQSRLCQDENGHFWRYLFTQKLSEKLPKSGISLKERYIQYLETKSSVGIPEMFWDINVDNLLKFAGTANYEILFQTLIESHSICPDTMLYRSSGYGFLTTVKYLDSVYRSIIHPYAYDIALNEAAKYGRLDVVRYLISSEGTYIHCDDDQALFSATIHGHLEVVKYLVEYDTITPKKIKEATRFASNGGHCAIVEYLMSRQIK